MAKMSNDLFYEEHDRNRIRQICISLRNEAGTDNAVLRFMTADMLLNKSAFIRNRRAETLYYPKGHKAYKFNHLKVLK